MKKTSVCLNRADWSVTKPTLKSRSVFPGIGKLYAALIVAVSACFKRWILKVRHRYCRCDGLGAVLTGLVLIIMPMQALAAQVTLAWDANEPAIQGYRVFQRLQGEAYDYANPAWPADGKDHTETTCTLNNLTAGGAYYFVVRAYIGNDQSGDSNEVFYKDGNHPPGQPTIVSPYDGESDVELTTLLEASDFDDPDSGDQLAQTQWRITLSNDPQQIVLELMCTKKSLTGLRVPLLVLDPGTSYTAQVRYFDNNGQSSPWSLPVIFTTAADPGDMNKNNIPDSQEISADTDMNGDNISDLEQTTVIKSVFTYNDQRMIGVSVEANSATAEIQATASIDPVTLESNGVSVLFPEKETPYGFLAYKIKVTQPGKSVQATIHLSDPIDPERIQWIRYDEDDGIQDSTAITEIDQSGLIVDRYLVDGGDQDADGVVNGVIVDLSGPRTTSSATDDSSLAISTDGRAASGGSSSGCYIRSLF